MNIEEAAKLLIKKLNDKNIDLTKYDIHKVVKKAEKKGITC